MILSIVVPCLNEEGSIAPFLGEIARLAPRLPEFEVIFVDDGSVDRTCMKIMELGKLAPHPVRLVRLSRNFGHQLALLAGLREARGQACVTIDCDLQDPPDLIPEMVDLWRKGNSVVLAQRADRESDSFTKRWTAAAFYRLMSILTGNSIPEQIGDFRLIDRQVLELLKNTREPAPYWRGLAAWVGFPRAIVKHRRRPRRIGESKFPLTRMISFALDGAFSFSRRPLQLATWLGGTVSLLSLAAVGVHLFWLVTGSKTYVPGWLSIASLIGLVGGVQLICLGILGEYVGRIYELGLGRPNVIVRDTWEAPDSGKWRVGNAQEDLRTP